MKQEFYKLITAILLIGFMPANAMMLQGGVDLNIDASPPVSEEEKPEIPASNYVEVAQPPVDYEGAKKSITLKDNDRANQKMSELDKNTAENFFYYNNGRYEYMGLKVNKRLEDLQ